MVQDNYERMIQLVTESFDMRNDPDQISVSPEEQKKLSSIHPSTLSEMANDDGPIVWILLIPTTQTIMERFLAKKISEKQLLDLTRVGDTYESVYLCSASVLPEFRRRGYAKEIALNAIMDIQKYHPIKSLYYWPFSDEGKVLARSLARALDLQLFERKK